MKIVKSDTRSDMWRRRCSNFVGAAPSAHWASIMVFCLSLATTGARADDVPTAADSNQLEEVVVTAQKRSEDIEKTPIAIVALTGNDLRMEARNSIEQQLEALPGVKLQNGTPNMATIFIRGIGPVVPGVDPTVAVSNDGIYQSTLGTSAQLDIARVEVLKGPQGTLYGRNSTAGEVNVITNDPSADTGGFVSLQAGNYAELMTEDVLNVPLTNTLYSRTAALYRTHSGYLSNGANDEDTAAAREKILYRPSNTFSALISVEYDHFGGRGSGVVPEPISSHADNPWYSPDVLGQQNTHKTQLYARMDWDLGFGLITYEPSYYFTQVSSDDVIVPVPVGPALSSNNSWQRSQELRVASEPTSTLKWQAGVYYLNYYTIVNPFYCCLINQKANGPTVTAQGFSTVSEAVFGQATYPVTSAFRATLGLRYNVDKKTIGDQVIYNSQTQQITGVDTTAMHGKSFPATTWKVGVEQDLSERSLLYADIAKGYKSGGFNGVGVTPISYGPESLVAYELGSKSRLFNNSWQVNADAYYYDYSNIQSNDTTGQLNANGLPTFAVENAGKAAVYGAEADVTGLVTPVDRVAATVAYNHAYYTHFDYHSTAFAPPPTYAISYDDKQMPEAPLWTETLSYEHTLQLRRGSTLALSGDIRFVSSSDSTINPVPDEEQPAYHLYDLRAVFKSPTGRWSATLFGNNLGNVAVRQYWAGISLTAAPSLSIGPPRTYGGTVTYNFGAQ